MADNPHLQTSRSDSPSVGYDPTRTDTAQNSPHDTDRDASPLTAPSESTAMTGRSDSILPTDAEGTTHPQAVAGEFLDAVTEARRPLLDRLTRT